MRLALAYHQMIDRGGLERYLLGLARELRRRGHRLTLVCGRVDEAFRGLGDPVMVRWRGPGAWRLADFSREAARVRRNWRGDAFLGFGRTVSQDLHRAGGGCHAIYSRLLPWWRRWSVKNRVELALERELYTGGGTRRFITNSAQVARELSAVYGVPEERFAVIRTPVDTARFHPAERLGAGGTFLFVSSGHRRKGLDALLEAMVRVPGASLWVAGAPLGRRYRGRVEALRLSGRVRELGEVSDMAAVMRQADHLVHPTLYDACANAVLQAMAGGLPPLVSVRDGASELVREGENGLLIRDPEQASCIAEAMERALALSPQERRAMAQAARQTVLPLTWEAHGDSWEREIGALELG